MLTRKIALTGFLLICGCADPRPPTGGPRDELPPSIVSTDPPHESVGVSPTELRLNFSEYVNEASFTRALSIVPAPRGRLKFRWRRRSVTIRLPESLRDSTTYVVTLNDEFRDWRGVRLTRPLSFAFATGPVIDQGRIRGRVIDHARGIPVAGLLVLAYHANTPINGDPAYQTQTDTGGRFEFNYVREADFFVIGLRDVNRNLKADPGERFAVPPKAIIRATPDTSSQYSDWIYTKVDTLGPRVERVRATTNQLVEIRFNKSILLPDLSGEKWMITDSLNNGPIKVYSSYQLESGTRTAYLVTDPLQEQTYRLHANPSVRDSSGNTVQLDTMYFVGNTLESANEPRFQEFLPTSSETPYQLAPWETPKIVFDQPVSQSLLGSLLNVQDSTSTSVNFEIQSSNGTTYALTLLNDPAQIYRVSVQQPDSTYVRFFQRLGSRDLGSLSGVTTPFQNHVLVVLTDSGDRILATETPNEEGHFRFHNLPENSYYLYAFIDHNQNGYWNGGLIYPYQAAEPIVWVSEPVTVRPRWDTALPDTLRIMQLSTESFPAADQ